MIHASHDAPVSTVTILQLREAVERATGREGEDHHGTVELRAHEVVDDRAAGPAHHAWFVAGAGVEREREAELLGHGPERVVGAVVVGPRRHLGGQEQRPEALIGDDLGVFDRTVDVEHRHHADGQQPVVVEHVAGPRVVRAAQLTLELGVVAGEARLQRERREDHLGAHAVAELVAADGRRRRSRRRPRPHARRPASACAGPRPSIISVRQSPTVSMRGHAAAVRGVDPLLRRARSAR